MYTTVRSQGAHRLEIGMIVHDPGFSRHRQDTHEPRYDIIGLEFLQTCMESRFGTQIRHGSLGAPVTLSYSIVKPSSS